MTGLSNLNGTTRAGRLSGSRAAHYLCLHCTRQVWRAGGVSSLGAHLATHGAAQQFPAFALVDEAGYVLSFDGARQLNGRRPIPAPTDVDGWVRNRLDVYGVA